MEEEDTICPRCNIAIPIEQKSPINTELCNLCISDLQREIRNYYKI